MTDEDRTSLTVICSEKHPLHVFLKLTDILTEKVAQQQVQKDMHRNNIEGPKN